MKKKQRRHVESTVMPVLEKALTSLHITIRPKTRKQISRQLQSILKKIKPDKIKSKKSSAKKVIKPESTGFKKIKTGKQLKGKKKR